MFDLPYRRVEGLAGSIVRLLGLALPIPDPTLRSRRAKTRSVQIPRRSRGGPIDVVVDSTGLKVYGEGEWKVRWHGAGQRRTGRKVHWAVDADVKDVVAVEVTPESRTDREVLAGLLEPMDDPIGHVRADGAYDTHGVYTAAEERGAEVTIPPRKNAGPWAPDPPRPQALAAVAVHGRPAWKQAVGDHRRGIAENARYRFKRLLGDRLASRWFETQVTEVHVRVAALNVMTYLGMPVSVPCRVVLS